MTGSTISTLVATSVTLGSSAYPSPLTITTTGTIAPIAGGSPGATALVATVSAGYVLNQGTVIGGEASSGGLGLYLLNGSLTNQGIIAGGYDTIAAGVGGVGAHVTLSTVSNAGTITGGNGISYITTYGSPGGDGGTGIDLSGSTFSNAASGVITGGAGGGAYAAFKAAIGGSGGNAIAVTGSSTLTNDGRIAGGAGGAAATPGAVSNSTGGTGGYGVSLAKGSILDNAGVIAGGSGGAAYALGSGARSKHGGVGGFAVGGAGSTIVNSGTIAGGSGYGGGQGVSLTAESILTNTTSGTIAGGAGGVSSGGATGVDAADGTLTNDGTIEGGAGGSGGGGDSGIISGNGGTGVSLTAGSLTNSGLIAGGSGGPNGYGGSGSNGGNGVYLGDGSGLTNTGTITGANAGAYYGMQVVFGFAGIGVDAVDSSLTNNGTIIGGSGGFRVYGVYAASSTVTNNGTIASGSFLGQLGGSFGTGVGLATGTLFNAGTITGAYNGAYVVTGGMVSNAAAGVIVSFRGVVVNGSGTVINAGSIIGGTYSGPGYPGPSSAVMFSGAGTDLLVVDPGAVFVGSVVAQGSPATLELGSGASTGTIAGIGSSFSGFGTITVDPNATWEVTGSVTGTGMFDLGTGSELIFNGGVAATSLVQFTADTEKLGLADPAGFASTVFGLQPGDAIDFTSITSLDTITAGVDATNHLTLTADGVLLIEIQLNPAQNFSADMFHTSPDGGHGTLVTEEPICFLAGTLIDTPSGEKPIQQLKVGDFVRTVRGGFQPIVWIGTGRVLATRGRRNAATPVIVRKGALGDNVPHHDLRVTKAHSLCLDGVLVPVEFLVNHHSILWDDRAQEVTLYHIELAAHDVLFANGAPAESYRDDGNRWLFRNANSGWHLPPKPPCAAVLTGGPMVDAIWLRLLQRSGAPAGLPLTDDPDLHLLADGRRLDAASRRDGRYVFHLSARPQSVRIVSRAASPQELGLARDPRCLGVALRQIMLRQGTRLRTIGPDDKLLTDGYHDFEADHAIRWTDGQAMVPASLFDGFAMPVELVLRLGGSTRYIDEGAARDLDEPPRRAA